MKKPWTGLVLLLVGCGATATPSGDAGTLAPSLLRSARGGRRSTAGRDVVECDLRALEGAS